jgi:bilirubin oxidase
MTVKQTLIDTLRIWTNMSLGMAPGPTFMVNKGREAVVRFINHSDRTNSVHLHGSYSRAPFDGWADDTTDVGEYKDYYYPNAQNARTLWYHDHVRQKTFCISFILANTD